MCVLREQDQGASTYQAHACVTRTNIPPICYSKSYDQTQRQYGWRQHGGHEYLRYGLMGATKRNFLFTLTTFQKERVILESTNFSIMQTFKQRLRNNL